MYSTVVIPTYNRIDVLKNTFRYWENQTVKDFEILIIDDNSTDGTQEVISDYSKKSSIKITLIRNDVNKGSADGRNKGLLCTNSDVVIYTDDDAFPSPYFIESHLKYHKKWDNAIVRGPIINFSDFSTIQSLTSSFFENSRKDFSLEIIRNLLVYLFGYSGNYFCTANVSIRREVALKAGLFNLDFKRWQDTEFGYRLRKLGIRRFFDFNAFVLHYKKSLSDPFKHYYNEGIYAAKLLKYHNNFSVKLRTGFFPFFPLWKILLNLNSSSNSLAYIKGFLDEYNKN